MSKEIERKYLLKDDSWRGDVEYSITIKQNYIQTINNVRIRIRTADDHAFVTIKSPKTGISRSEYEYEIPMVDAVELFNLCDLSIIVKKRHIINSYGMKWEIDEFEEENKGLIVAEVELHNEFQKFIKPLWLGKEVSYNEKYTSSNLANKPYNKWNN